MASSCQLVMQSCEGRFALIDDLWRTGTGVVAAGALLTAKQAQALDQGASTEKERTKVVVLGSGWAAISFLKALRPLHSMHNLAAGLHAPCICAHVPGASSA